MDGDDTDTEDREETVVAGPSSPLHSGLERGNESDSSSGNDVNPVDSDSDDEALPGRDKTKRRNLLLDSDDDEEEVSKETKIKPVSDSEDEETKIKSLSDSEDEKTKIKPLSDSEDENEEGRDKSRSEDEHKEEVECKNEKGLVEGQQLDFDIMLQRKKDENRRSRKRKKIGDIDVINDNDDAMAKLMADMRLAAREDRELNEMGQPATKKLSLLPIVTAALGKIDLRLAFVEANILAVLTDWLAPLPSDKSLPHIKIRKMILNFLMDVPIDDYSRLKESGVGKAVMYLYRHPKEERGNKHLCGKIISKWSRPIFRLTCDFASLDKDERKARDQEMARRLGFRKRKAEETATAKRPGDPGWVPRARVPMPDTSEYVQRPEWQSHVDMEKISKKEISWLEKHKRRFADKRKITKVQQAVKISIEGKNMNL